MSAKAELIDRDQQIPVDRSLDVSYGHAANAEVQLAA